MIARNTVYIINPLKATHSVAQNRYPKSLLPATVIITIPIIKKKAKIAIIKDAVDKPFLVPVYLIKIK
jgi:hypothetical protein